MRGTNLVTNDDNHWGPNSFVIGVLAQRIAMSDDLPVSLDELKPDEIQELLAEEGIEATEEQIKLITAFVISVGGLENAQGLFDELRQLRPAA